VSSTIKQLFFQIASKILWYFIRQSSLTGLTLPLIWSIPLLRRASLSPWSSFSRKRRSSAWQICFCSTHDLVRFFLLVTMHWFVACLLMGMVPSQTGTITIHVPVHCIKWLVTDSTIEDELLKT
jgi:hypothetical protein